MRTWKWVYIGHNSQAFLSARRKHPDVRNAWPLKSGSADNKHQPRGGLLSNLMHGQLWSAKGMCTGGHA